MRLFFIIIISVLLASCEGIVEGKGKIISSTDHKPIDSVFVYWTNYFETTSYSDSIGNFKIGSFCGCVPECPELEVIFYKKGYTTKYVNLTKEYNSTNLADITIQLTPSNVPSEQIKEKSFGNFLQYFNTVISLFNIFTLIMIFRVKLKKKVLWILSLIFLSITIRYNYFTGDFKFQPFSFFLQYRFLVIYYIGWYVYFIPTVAIIFWSCFFYKKRQGQKLF